MGTVAPKLCTGGTPGCTGRVVDRSQRYCPACAPAHTPEIHRTRKGPRPYDKALWRKKIRPAILNERPECEDCKEQGRSTPATDVDHMDGNPYNNDPGNLRALCHPCHSSKTARQDGRWG